MPMATTTAPVPPRHRPLPATASPNRRSPPRRWAIRSTPTPDRAELRGQRPVGEPACQQPGSQAAQHAPLSHFLLQFGHALLQSALAGDVHDDAIPTLHLALLVQVRVGLAAHPAPSVVGPKNAELGL